MNNIVCECIYKNNLSDEILTDLEQNSNKKIADLNNLQHNSFGANIKNPFTYDAIVNTCVLSLCPFSFFCPRNTSLFIQGLCCQDSIILKCLFCQCPLLRQSLCLPFVDLCSGPWFGCCLCYAFGIFDPCLNGVVIGNDYICR
jgi:hypothetical protein